MSELNDARQKRLHLPWIAECQGSLKGTCNLSSYDAVDGLMCSKDAKMRDIALANIQKRKQKFKILSTVYLGKDSKSNIYVPWGDLGGNTFLLIGCWRS